MAIADKIKLCPFCGRKPWIARDLNNDNEKVYGIGCTNIDCFLWLPNDFKQGELHNYTAAYYEKSVMLEEWNKRALNGRGA